MNFQPGDVPRNYTDMAGARLGALLVKERVGRNKGGMAMWRCVCDCGRQLLVQSGNLRHRQRSCGCDRKTSATHGMTKTPEYKAWTSMIQRCYNDKQKSFRHYGGRGISVCESWRQSFEVFMRDIGKRPTDAHSLDRIDVNGHYEPSNCRWATPLEQARNKRCAVTADGVHVADLSVHHGLKNSTARYRIKHGVALDKKVGRQIELVAAGLKMSMTDWSRLTGIARSTISVRYKKGWSHGRILGLELSQ